MAKYEDKVAYSHKPDQLIGSENDGNGEGIEFSISRKKSDKNSRMPIIEDAYDRRYKEYR